MAVLRTTPDALRRCASSLAPQRLAPGAAMAALAAQGCGGAAGARWQWRNRRRGTFGLARQLLPMGARTMFIQTQSTPNPESLMFVPGRPVMERGSADFPDHRSAGRSPLARKLFAVDGVAGLFFGSDFVTVTKKAGYEWAMVKPDVFAAIMDFFASGQPIMLNDDEVAQDATAIQEDDCEVVQMIKELLDTRIRPAVQDDGGDIVFEKWDEETGVVYLKLQGACSGCPSSSVTLKSGVENMLMHYIPEVKGVEQSEPDEAEKAGLSEFEKLEARLEESSEAPPKEGA